eukprot:gene2649-1647_t
MPLWAVGFDRGVDLLTCSFLLLIGDWQFVDALLAGWLFAFRCCVMLDFGFRLCGVDSLLEGCVFPFWCGRRILVLVVLWYCWLLRLQKVARLLPGSLCVWYSLLLDVLDLRFGCITGVLMLQPLSDTDLLFTFAFAVFRVLVYVCYFGCFGLRQVAGLGVIVVTATFVLGYVSLGGVFYFILWYYLVCTKWLLCYLLVGAIRLVDGFIKADCKLGFVVCQLVFVKAVLFICFCFARCDDDVIGVLFNATCGWLHRSLMRAIVLLHLVSCYCFYVLVFIAVFCFGANDIFGCVTLCIYRIAVLIVVNIKLVVVYRFVSDLDLLRLSFCDVTNDVTSRCFTLWYILDCGAVGVAYLVMIRAAICMWVCDCFSDFGLMGVGGVRLEWILFLWGVGLLRLLLVYGLSVGFLARVDQGGYVIFQFGLLGVVTFTLCPAYFVVFWLIVFVYKVFAFWWTTILQCWISDLSGCLDITLYLYAVSYLVWARVRYWCLVDQVGFGFPRVSLLEAFGAGFGRRFIALWEIWLECVGSLHYLEWDLDAPVGFVGFADAAGGIEFEQGFGAIVDGHLSASDYIVLSGLGLGWTPRVLWGACGCVQLLCGVLCVAGCSVGKVDFGSQRCLLVVSYVVDIVDGSGMGGVEPIVKICSCVIDCEYCGWPPICQRLHCAFGFGFRLGTSGFVSYLWVCAIALWGAVSCQVFRGQVDFELQRCLLVVSYVVDIVDGS